MLEPDCPAIRLMELEDLDEVMEIEERAYTHPWSRAIFRDCLRVGYHCVVYDSIEGIRAYAALTSGAGEAHVLNLCVAPEYRRQGLGRRLLEHLIRHCEQVGVETLFLEVRPSNLAAIELYSALGFNEIGLRKDYYPTEMGREDAVMFAKCLIPEPTTFRDAPRSSARDRRQRSRMR